MKFKFLNIFFKEKVEAVPEKVEAVPFFEENETIMIMKMEKVNIKALAGTTMEAGKVYTVSEESSKILIKNNRAVAAKDSEKVGKIYSYPQKKEGGITD